MHFLLLFWIGKPGAGRHNIEMILNVMILIKHANHEKVRQLTQSANFGVEKTITIYLFHVVDVLAHENFSGQQFFASEYVSIIENVGNRHLLFFISTLCVRVLVGWCVCVLVGWCVCTVFLY